MKLRLAVFFLLLTVCLTQGSDFIDDDQRTKDFESRLAEIAENKNSLTMAEAEFAIEKSDSLKVPIARPQPKTSPEKPSALYRKCTPAIVAIGSVFQCPKCEKWHGSGFSSGWIASSDGLIVTNAHLFQDGKEDPLGVMTLDGEVFPVEKIISANKTTDIAILKINAGAKKLPALPLAESAQTGEDIHVISHPQGRLYCLTSGRISRFHHQKYEEDSEPSDWMSVTADFAGGSSGGPVLNDRGEVVGMVSSTLTAYSESLGCKKLPDPEVQMVFKDCVPLKSLRAMFDPRD